MASGGEHHPRITSLSFANHPEGLPKKSATLVGMAPKNNERFARIVAEAFSALGVTQSEFNRLGGPSDTTLRKIMDGEPVGISTRTLRGLDMAFNWSAGSAARTLVGGSPTPDELSREVREAKGREFREVKQRVGEIYDAMQRQPDEASVRAEGRIRSAARLLDSATDALAQRDHARAIEDLDTSVVVIRSTITAIKDIALQKGLPNADQSSTDTDPSAQSDASSKAPEVQEVGDGEEVVRPLRPAHWDDAPPPPPIELADAASVGHKESDEADDASE